VYAEQYILSIEVEAKLVKDIAKTQLYPAAVKYISKLSATNSSLSEIGISLDKDSIEALVSLTNSMMSSVSKLSDAIDAHEFDTVEDHMTFCAQTICPLMAEVRSSADELEGLVADDYWPLPKYQEMLFIK
jgi:glutamine synthetase